jgi:calpain-5
MMHGDWALPHRVGGCINNRNTFLNNPQYCIEVSKEDEVILELTQKMHRLPGKERETIGFTILQVEENRSYRLHILMPVVQSSVFRNSRSVLVRRILPRGRYVVVICMFEPGVIGSFLFRSYTGSSTRVRELVLDRPDESPCSCIPVFRNPVVVTQIRIIQANGLKRTTGEDVDAFCEVSCEGEILKTSVEKKTSNPEWNFFAVFYRKDPLQKPIRVDVWHYNSIGFNEYLGGQVYIAATDIREEQVELPLLNRDEVIQPGRLLIVVTTSHNLAAV